MLIIPGVGGSIYLRRYLYYYVESTVLSAVKSE